MPTGIFASIWKTIRRIPRGKVATYGDVAAASGYPGAARQVVWALRAGKALPWHRVLGAKGVIRLPGENGLEQRLRLRTEGVTVTGNRVNLAEFGHRFREKQKPGRG
ncbi:MAG TPA: MGMT family protein [Bryobacteraceae bacterium]|nr:MGMT family protein [Bryobacteraceae bacterium]